MLEIDRAVYEALIVGMLGMAAVVFVSLYFVTAGYGKMISPKWGPTLNNKLAWCVMEAPVFGVMLYYCITAETRSAVSMAAFGLFELHYFQRAFIFPLLLKGKGRMPIAIVGMGIVFNTINGILQGTWLFRLSDYGTEWLGSPQFVAGVAIFLVGMGINLHSDHVIRTLRKPGDTKHYLPRRGMYRYVTSANYLGEIVEWTGFAILTWSGAGLVFMIWTMANLVPRADAIWKRYKTEFAEEMAALKPKRVFPKIY